MGFFGSFFGGSSTADYKSREYFDKRIQTINSEIYDVEHELDKLRDDLEYHENMIKHHYQKGDGEK